MLFKLRLNTKAKFQACELVDGSEPPGVFLISFIFKPKTN